MPAFQNLLFPEEVATVGNKASQNGHPRGCEYCPSNKVKGIHKILGTVLGKEIMVWAQSPGPEENEHEPPMELIGRSGRWWWAELAKVGIQRKDCDIQNAGMRCFPGDRDLYGGWVMRDPTKEELQCCSVYTEQAVRKSRAKVHLVLGRIAAKALFGKDKPEQRVFWSDKLNGQVFLLDHPAFFLRGAPAARLEQFRALLKEASKYVLGKTTGPMAYIKQQDYKAVKTAQHALQVEQIILKAANKGERVVVDLEWGKLESGKKVILTCGFSIKAGWARSFVIDYPEANDIPEADRQEIREVAKRILANPKISKAFHHGDSDTTEAKDLLDTKVGGYHFDTNYSEYLKYPGQYHYKLDDIADRRFPEMTGYKEVVMPEAAPEGVSYENARRLNLLNFTKVPLKKLVLRNCGDCDLTKRIELSTKVGVSMPLLQVYIDAAYTLRKMESNGPLFDYVQSEALEKIYPVRLKAQRQKLQVMARDPEFNPGSPEQVKEVLYGKLNLPNVNGKRAPDTQKDTLEQLRAYHPMPGMILNYRSDSKVESTYVVGFRRSAQKHNGRVRTIWWQTGTSTGRNSSGGGKSEKNKEDGLVNLQNIHLDPQVRNMLVSDLRWRDLYNAWRRGIFKLKDFLDLVIFLAFDYAQMEIRVLAHMSDEPEYIRGFNSGEDIHSVVGHDMTNWPVDKIKTDKKTRQLVKNLHFGMIYGLQGPGMLRYLAARGVKTTLGKVNEYLGNYFRKYKRVKEFIEGQWEFCNRHGYVKNPWGFAIPIEVENDNGPREAHWKSCAVNYPIQGAANQILRMALALLHRKPVTYKLIEVPNAEVHDNLMFSDKLRELAEAAAVGRKLMEQDVIDVIRNEFRVDWKIPLQAECEVGFRFGVKVPYESGADLTQVIGNWCTENQILQKKLYAEIRSVEQLVVETPAVKPGLLF